MVENVHLQGQLPRPRKNERSSFSSSASHVSLLRTYLCRLEEDILCSGSIWSRVKICFILNSGTVLPCATGRFDVPLGYRVALPVGSLCCLVSRLLPWL